MRLLRPSTFCLSFEWRSRLYLQEETINKRREEERGGEGRGREGKGREGRRQFAMRTCSASEIFRFNKLD